MRFKLTPLGPVAGLFLVIYVTEQEAALRPVTIRRMSPLTRTALRVLAILTAHARLTLPIRALDA
jgi:hypothetical protein